MMEYDYHNYARKTVFSIVKNTINVCVADGMYLIEEAGIITD